MMEHMALSWDFFAPYLDVSPGLTGLEGREGLFTHLEMKAWEQLPVRHFAATPGALVRGESDTAFRHSGLENPAGCLAKVKGDLVPLWSLLAAGSFSPGARLPPDGVAFSETPGAL